MNYRKNDLRIKENSLIAKIAACKLKSARVAIVLGKTIYLHNTSRDAFLKDEKWVKHEMCHLKQFRQHGFFPFIFMYLLQSIRRGYHYNKFEVEAREVENL